MNTNINTGAGFEVALLAAGAIFAYGVWMGRRDLGFRAALGVLGASLWSLLPVGLWFLSAGGRSTPGGALPFLIGLSWVLSFALSFLPVYVAVNWLEVIRWETRPRE
ncbi:hypothetical protein [Deinococcus arcticus]|uniref:Uncharacterized protein n=1 Tax=Deinococcus arcticus TaxID=2136176 RepID=A0A2T3W6R6_9DEIO|nr:hypothetical protein [Deinococcus arcticus]PTA67542.1 hypothetical protein C8263_11935 [Deinococcus arcticus]